MNNSYYSKGALSMARTVDYSMAQPPSGQYLSPNLGYSVRPQQLQNEPRIYPGDASQAYIYPSKQSAHSYNEYAMHLAASQQVNPKLAQSEHIRFQLPQQYQYRTQFEQNRAYQAQQPDLYYSNAHYIPQKQPYQRQFLTFRPMMPNQATQVPQSRIPLDSREPYHQYDFKVFCPACHQQYYNSQVEQHIERHYLYNTDQFKISSNLDRAAQQPIQHLTNQSRFYYPLIEPQEFECKELDEVDYLNKYKLQHQELNKKQTNVKVKSQSTQFAKPPLQLRSQNTDIYNCFDNIFNPNNTFDVKDITSSNTIIAKKRKLDDWEKLNSHKEGYKIKSN